eukprot:m.16617 g.16617  ORF g.16617 m.16617 type:complete len:190 (+) comp27040_c0_seq4:96-665(+)
MATSLPRRVFLISDYEDLLDWMSALLKQILPKEECTLIKLLRDDYFKQTLDGNCKFVFVASQRGRCQLYSKENRATFYSEIDDAEKTGGRKGVLIVVKWPTNASLNEIHDSGVEFWKDGHQLGLEKYADRLLTAKDSLNERQLTTIKDTLEVHLFPIWRRYVTRCGQLFRSNCMILFALGCLLCYFYLV